METRIGFHSMQGNSFHTITQHSCESAKCKFSCIDRETNLLGAELIRHSNLGWRPPANHEGGDLKHDTGTLRLVERRVFTIFRALYSDSAEN